MTYTVHMSPNFARGGFDVVVVARMGSSNHYWVSSDGQLHSFEENATATATEDRAFVHLPDELTHPLLGALARTLGAIEHPEQLRRDYEAERSRVDKMIDHLIERTS